MDVRTVGRFILCVSCAMLAVLACGCDTLVDHPKFVIGGQIQNVDATSLPTHIAITLSELDSLRASLGGPTPQCCGDVVIEADGTFNCTFPPSHDIVSALSSKATKRTRNLFLSPEGDPFVYHIQIRKRRATVQMTATNAVDDLIAHQHEVIELEDGRSAVVYRHYSVLDWVPAPNVVVKGLERSRTEDSLTLVIHQPN